MSWFDLCDQSLFVKSVQSVVLWSLMLLVICCFRESMCWLFGSVERRWFLSLMSCMMCGGSGLGLCFMLPLGINLLSAIIIMFVSAVVIVWTLSVG